MQYKLHSLLAASMLSIGSFVASAQTTSTFEEVVLPGADTGFLESKYPNAGVHTILSGNALFYGNVADNSWGYSWSEFNCSNATDTFEISYSKAAVAIPGSGYNSSANYAIANVPIDFMGPDPSATIPVGAKLQGAAAGEQVFGAYFSNSVYAYRYMLDGNKYANNHFWLKLIVRGYHNGVKSTDSVSFTLADYTNTASPVLVNNWQWVNLTGLGDVDSLTFDLISNDTAGGYGINTPSYFAMDNLVTSDGQCPAATNLTASAITVSGAQLTWTNAIAGMTPVYEVAVDQTAALAPAGTTTNVTATSHPVTGLNSNTTYYAHIRSACGNGGFSAWDTVAFKTLPGTGIFNTPDNALAASISPNPASNILNITAAVAVNAVIYSIEGKQILEQKNAQKIDISVLANGVYLLKVTDLQGNASGTLRFAKTN